MGMVIQRKVLRPNVDWFRPTTELEAELRQIEARILHQASQFDPGAEGYVRYALEGGGKRLRPALVLLAGKAAGGWTDPVRDLAVIVELVHVASLIHDDVLDRAELRRARATCNAKWGTELSVLLGDALFAHGLQLATRLEDAEVARKIAEASRNLCEGEILQTQRRFDLKMTTADYLHVIGLKTGAVLDLVGTDAESGKTLGTDVRKGKWTLPILHALQTLPAGEAEALRAQLVEGEADVVGKVRSAGGVRFSMRKAVELLERAKADLQVLGDPEGELLGLTERLQNFLRQMEG